MPPRPTLSPRPSRRRASLGVPWFVLGLGANILVGDRGFRGVVIRNLARAHAITPDGRLQAESGAIMRDLVLDSVAQGWSGLEHYVGIPSTVGGALWQNLHFLSPAPARERTMFIAEVFESCEILTEEGERTRGGRRLRAVRLRRHRLPPPPRRGAVGHLPAGAR